jgi:hypothetical protein
MTEQEMDTAVDWLRRHPKAAKKQAVKQDYHCGHCEGPLDCWIPVFVVPPKEFYFVCERCHNQTLQ